MYINQIDKKFPRIDSISRGMNILSNLNTGCRKNKTSNKIKMVNEQYEKNLMKVQAMRKIKESIIKSNLKRFFRFEKEKKEKNILSVNFDLTKNETNFIKYNPNNKLNSVMKVPSILKKNNKYNHQFFKLKKEKKPLKIIAYLPKDHSNTLPKHMLEFYEKFSNSIEKEFESSIKIEKKEKINSNNPKDSQNEILNINSTLFNWCEANKNISASHFLKKLNFKKNYDLLLKNVFDSKNDQINHYYDFINSFLKKKLKNKFFTICNTHVKSQEKLTNLVLILFLLHLDIPKPLWDSLKKSSQLLIIIVILNMLFETKDLIGYAHLIPDKMFFDDSLFNISKYSTLSFTLKKHIYFSVWYLDHVLKNFDKTIMEINSNSGNDRVKESIIQLFSFKDVRDKSFSFKNNLLELIKNIDVNKIQQLFLFLKNKFNKNKNISKRSYQRYNKKIYYYSQDNKIKFISVNSRIFNGNYFNKIINKKNKAMYPLRKMKRNQEMCIYIGPRIKNFIIQCLSINNNTINSNKSIFTFSQKRFDNLAKKMRTKNKTKNLELKKINYLLNQKIDSSYKIPVHLFKSMMCTDQYSLYSREFFKNHYLTNELNLLFSRGVFHGKEDIFNDISLIEHIFLPRHKMKLPWALIELLNAIPYISNLEKNISFKYIKI